MSTLRRRIFRFVRLLSGPNRTRKLYFFLARSIAAFFLPRFGLRLPTGYGTRSEEFTNRIFAPPARQGSWQSCPLWPNNSNVRRAAQTSMRYVVELTLSGPEEKSANQTPPATPRVESVEIDADDVPSAIQKAKEKFKESNITDVNIRFR
jgi:hypothetical protein